jgi:hypothetical protein
MDQEQKRQNEFTLAANFILLFEYLVLMYFLGHSYYFQQLILKKKSALISTFYSFLFCCSLLRVLLFLDVGLDYRLSTYTIILFLGVLPYFSAASIMIYIWYDLNRFDIYMLTRWDIEISSRFKVISRFKLFEILLNLSIWIVFFILSILSGLDIGDASK